MACVYVYVIILTFMGPENLGRSFDIEHDDDLAEVTGKAPRGASMAKHAEQVEERASAEAGQVYQSPMVRQVREVV